MSVDIARRRARWRRYNQSRGGYERARRYENSARGGDVRFTYDLMVRRVRLHAAAEASECAAYGLSRPSDDGFWPRMLAGAWANCRQWRQMCADDRERKARGFRQVFVPLHHPVTAVTHGMTATAAERFFWVRPIPTVGCSALR